MTGGYVVDASVAVEFILKTPIGLTLTGALSSATLIAPELLDAEVLSALRRAWLSNRLDSQQAETALNDLVLWPVERLSLRSLAPLAWEFRGNVSAYDAFYVAAARAFGIPLLTSDGRLAHAPVSGVDIEYVHQ